MKYISVKHLLDFEAAVCIAGKSVRSTKIELVYMASATRSSSSQANGNINC